MEHYVLIQWPDSQQVIETAILQGWEDECFLAPNDSPEESQNCGPLAYFVPVRRIEGMQKVNRETIGKHLLDYQLAIVGKTRVDMMEESRWRFLWTLTREQYNAFRGYAIPLIKKIFKCNKSKAENSFDFFYQLFGLRIKG